MFIGKIIGALIGNYTIGGFWGVAIGALAGHFLFDRRRFLNGTGGWQPGRFGQSRASAADIQAAFFEATFSVMGHVAKADGRVDEREIAMAEQLMTYLQLDADRRREAIAHFNRGKQSDFSLPAAIQQFRSVVAAGPLMMSFLEFQIQAALADGEFKDSERAILLDIAREIGMPEAMYLQLERLVILSVSQATGHPGFGAGGGGHQQRQASGTNTLSLADAYTILGVTPSDDRNTVKTAWRKLMSEHHPDKLVAQGLPEEMMELANEKAQSIQKAWEVVREARGWR